ncbi:hypothetical protein V1389_06440 [Flavobacterium rakeshii]|uniref:hypothetical protein n=1 Tax=Flavobacterium rakeshii TaxID=1038845 RepID=UPI002E7B22BB|nr:hypothetical protein [Flavobacterium rakeshii]MEE1897964.1 hypothetical protein [Flavobacterium rakeshii]
MFIKWNIGKKKINKFILVLFYIILVGCSGKTKEDYLINGKDDYWEEYDEIQSGKMGQIYYKFYSNGTYDRYRTNLNNEYILFNDDGDLLSERRTWSVSEDSILKWGEHRLDIVDYNDNTIILYLNRQRRYIFLFKEKKGSNRKGSQYYIDKRKEYPEKYPEPYSSVNNQ